MKQVLVFVLLLIGLRVAAQHIDTTTYLFCDAQCNSKIESTIENLTDVNIFLDFGNGVKYGPENPMLTKGGYKIDLNSIVTLMNYMSDEKWTLDKAYAIYVTKGISSRAVTFLIFKKPKYK